MQTTVEIENIEEIRRQEGIDDVDLRMEIRSLKVGDFVKLTFLTSATAFETLVVRITSIRGSAFRGKLVKRGSPGSRSKLEAGASVAFTTAHIHSLLKREEANGE
jgi:hypothetical protein